MRVVSPGRCMSYAAGRERLREALASSDVLKTVHESQARLQAIWHKAGASQEALLAALQDWCHQAEASGIDPDPCVPTLWNSDATAGR